MLVLLCFLGLQNEGWFDPYLFLAALKLKCASLEVQFVQGEVNGFTTKDVLIRDSNNFDKAYREKNLDQVCVRIVAFKCYAAFYDLLILASRAL